jgi:16S rRNA processing protein RimM
MVDRPERLEVGRITKPHALRGELVVLLTTDRLEERTRRGVELWTGAGRRLVVAAARPHHDRWIVAFEGVERREDADLLRGASLFAAPLEDPDVVFAHQVIGRRLVDQHGVDHGRVIALEANPASDLLVLDDDRLVPLTFLVAVEGDSVVVDVPPGLLG